MTIAIDAADCRNFESAINKEWLVTNGLGGYAMGTVSGANSRKYHGYLVVAANPPVQRYVLLSRVEDHILVDGVSYDLGTDEFPDVIHPQGYQHLLSFTQNAGPVWRFEVGGVIIEKSLTLLHGSDAVIVRYVLIGPAPGAVLPETIRLQVQPMLAGRDFHATIQVNYRPGWRAAESETEPATILLSAPECPVKLALTHNADSFTLNPCWWYNFIFRQERMRGYPDRDDLWTPGVLEFSLTPGKPVGFICSTKPIPFSQSETLIKQAAERHDALASSFAGVEPQDPFLAQLALAADQFVVRRGSSGTAGASKMSIIAGYPWFEDWGRDTFISLAGLTLVTNRHEAARMILDVFAEHRRRGLLPNRFPDKAHTPEYHTVDAALWFVHAAYQYWRYTDDVKFLTSYLYPALCEIVESYRDGTDFGIRADEDGLIRAGEPHVQLTWMDAKVGDWVVTPRHGKPVEINALWYNALKIMTLVSRAADDLPRASAFAELAAKVSATFQDKFWNPVNTCLYDVVDDHGGKDPSIRPNQLIAVSLPFSPLTHDVQAKVIDTAQKLLLTPMGMRTLAPGSLGYHGRCAGDQLARDMAYHQGTVWPWLIGPFVTGYVKVHRGTVQAQNQAREFLKPFEDHLLKAGLGSISEIADGDPPFTPRGTVAQAWSVAEVLRAYWEDVLARAPAWPHERLATGPGYQPLDIKRGSAKV